MSGMKTAPTDCLNVPVSCLIAGPVASGRRSGSPANENGIGRVRAASLASACLACRRPVRDHRREGGVGDARVCLAREPENAAGPPAICSLGRRNHNAGYVTCR